MDPKPANDHDADLPAVRRTIARKAPIDAVVPLNGPVVFAWIDGQASRTLHFAGDPLVVLPELEHTDAF